MESSKAILPATVKDLAKVLRLARARQGDVFNPRGRAVFWIGAGASVSAGLPSGRQLAGRLALRLAVLLGHLDGSDDSDEPLRHQQALDELQRAGGIAPGYTLSTAYGQLFAELDAVHQREFIRSVIEKTNRRKINWSHLAVGELVRQRIVHTVLTTNFDDLLLDGLVRSDQLPAIIDGVESLNRMDPRPPVPQLVYLHGSQHTYSPRNSTEAVQGTRDLPQAHGGLYGLLQQCSALVVVGYAGNPGEGVMELLLRVCRSLPELVVFWVSHGQQDALSPMTVELLSTLRHGRLLPGQDADLFFRELLQEMRIGVPSWFQQPVEHLQQMAGRISVGPGIASAPLREEVDDFCERLERLQQAWLASGQINTERRELRQLILRDDHAEVWRRLADRTLEDVAMLQMRAEAAYELSQDGMQPELLPHAVRDCSAVLRKLPHGTAKWALAQDRLGDALAALGEGGDERAIRDAIAAYDDALSIHTRNANPIKWASTRHNQGLALLTLGEWGDSQALEMALQALSDALEVYRQDSTPYEWATAQANRASALQLLGERGDPRQLEEAIEAYSQALRIRTREQMPLDWAMTQCNRAGALIALGEQGQAPMLQEALSQLELASQTVPRDSRPLHWAAVRYKYGLALLVQARCGDVQQLRKALSVLQKALEVQAKAQAWAATPENFNQAVKKAALRGEAGVHRKAREMLNAVIDTLRQIDTAQAQGEAIDVGGLATGIFDDIRRMALPTKPSGTAKSKVLVVEDNETQQAVIEGLLRNCIRVSEIRPALDGKQALSALEEFCPDLLILDLGLPDMPGQQILGLARRHYPYLPVLVYSADTQAVEVLQQDATLEAGSARLAILQKESDKESEYKEFMQLVPSLFRWRQRDAHG